ncbi:hypothetical protein Tco_0218395 [Tanacetum coccineum]
MFRSSLLMLSFRIENVNNNREYVKSGNVENGEVLSLDGFHGLVSSDLVAARGKESKGDMRQKLKTKEEEEKHYVWPEWLTKGGKKKSQSGGTIPDVTGQRMVVGTGKYTTVKPKQFSTVSQVWLRRAVATTSGQFNSELNIISVV